MKGGRARSRRVRFLKADPLLFALIGEKHPLTEGSLVERLSACGWSPKKVIAFAAACATRGEPWPVKVPDELVEDGFAQFAAALTDARTELGLLGRHVGSAPRRPLTAEERRLVSECPPHWS